MIINQMSRKIESIYIVKRIRIDGGRKKLNKALSELCETFGVILRARFQEVRAALIGFWAEAAEHMARIYNITINERYGTSPQERAFGTRPDLSWVHAFHVRCFSFEPVERRSNKKLSPRAMECRRICGRPISLQAMTAD